MGGRRLGVLCLLIIMIYTPHKTKAEIPQETVDKIKTGLKAGQQLAAVLTDGNLVKSLVSLGTKLAPFLGVLGPIASLAFQFIPTGDSPELAYMKEQFKVVNNKLDIVISEFKEVKNAIDWSAIKVSYGTYERKIRAAEINLNRAYSLQGKAFEVEKDNFITNFKESFHNSLEKLYDGIMNDDHVFSKNILEAAMKQTKNHKRKVEKFALGLTQLLVKGIEVKVSYYALTKKPHDHLIREWEEKMKKLSKKLVEVSNRIKKAYKEQLKEDVKTLIDSHYELENKALMRKIYNFVVDKFDWRYWFVAVYADVQGRDKHAIGSCGGVNFLHTKGKNIVTSSQDKKYFSRFNKKDAEKVLEGVKGTVSSCSEETRNPDDRASTLVGQMRKSVGKTCVPYALAMAVETLKDLWFISFNSHLAYRKIDKAVVCKRAECGWFGCSTKTVEWNFNMILFG